MTINTDKNNRHSDENNVYANETMPKSKTKRIYKYDNLRGLGMILVVLGHLMVYYEIIQPTIGVMISVIAMPLVFFVSGYLSKIKNSDVKKLFTNLLIPYVIFTLVWILFEHFILKFKFANTPFITEYLLLWYLFSLFIMRLLLPAIIKLKYSFWITLAIGLIIGIFPLPDNFLVLSKTFCMFPVFLLGYYIKNPNESSPILNKIIKVFTNLFKNKYVLLIIFIIILAIMSIIFTNWDLQIFQLKSSYESLDLRILPGIIMRFLVIIAGIILIFLLNYLMPNKKTFLTKIGINSLALYIFHFYLIKIFAKILFIYDYNGHLLIYYLKHDLILGYGIIFISWLFITFVLSRDVVTNITNKLIGLFGKILMKD
ncbi:MAG: acyltransferase family protein [Methanobrevibacter sp.]|nr:acyltransferase family protein [Candidatus Methanoflexus mossambicus]